MNKDWSQRIDDGFANNKSMVEVMQEVHEESVEEGYRNAIADFKLFIIEHGIYATIHTETLNNWIKIRTQEEK